MQAAFNNHIRFFSVEQAYAFCDIVQAEVIRRPRTLGKHLVQFGNFFFVHAVTVIRNVDDEVSVFDMSAYNN